MSHTTVHRRLQELAQRQDPFGAMKERAFRFLLVDGTKVHLQGSLGKDLGQVEMRWALASMGSLSRFEPVGFWIDTEWAEIRKELERRLEYDKLEVLFCDGGIGIEESLLHPAMKPQRCQWHGKREFPYFLYADGFKKAEQQSLVEKNGGTEGGRRLQCRVQSSPSRDARRRSASARPEVADVERFAFRLLHNPLGGALQTPCQEVDVESILVNRIFLSG
jgi:hypothetical protein